MSSLTSSWCCPLSKLCLGRCSWRHSRPFPWDWMCSFQHIRPVWWCFRTPDHHRKVASKASLSDGLCSVSNPTHCAVCKPKWQKCVLHVILIPLYKQLLKNLGKPRGRCAVLCHLTVTYMYIICIIHICVYICIHLFWFDVDLKGFTVMSGRGRPRGCSEVDFTTWIETLVFVF